MTSLDAATGDPRTPPAPDEKRVTATRRDANLAFTTIPAPEPDSEISETRGEDAVERWPGSAAEETRTRGEDDRGPVTKQRSEAAHMAAGLVATNPRRPAPDPRGTSTYSGGGDQDFDSTYAFVPCDDSQVPRLTPLGLLAARQELARHS